MRRLSTLPLLGLCSLLFVSCQNRLQSESGLYNVELQHNIKVPVKGYWTWGKGNPYASHRTGRIYIHPMDISKIRKSDPEAAPIMAMQMQDYLTQAIAAALQEANKAARKERQLILKQQEEIERIRQTTIKLQEKLKSAGENKLVNYMKFLCVFCLMLLANT